MCCRNEAGAGSISNTFSIRRLAVRPRGTDLVDSEAISDDGQLLRGVQVDPLDNSCMTCFESASTDKQVLSLEEKKCSVIDNVGT